MPLPSLYTVVKNPTGTARRYGFLPTHGAQIAAGASLSIPGDLVTRLSTGRTGGDRDFKALEKCLTDELIVIVRSPGLFLYNPDTAETRLLALQGVGEDEALGTLEPDWIE